MNAEARRPSPLPVLACLAVVLAAACGRVPEGVVGGPGAGKRSPRAYPVEVAPVATRDLDYVIEAVGSLEAEEDVPVVARVPGVIESVAFQEADAVTPETELATIDLERYALAAARARATHSRARADLREAESAFARRTALREKDPGWVGEEELTTYATAVERAKAALAEAKAALDLSEKDERDARVRPPKAGTINAKSVATGQFVERGRAIAQLIDPRRLRLRFRLTEPESVRVSPDLKASFRTRAHPGREFPAAIYHVGRQADPGTRMVDVLAWVENADGALKPGFFAEVTVKVASRASAPVVPAAAILPTERGLVAFVAEGRVARERRPRLGLHTADGMVEILEGLAAGESLVVKGAQPLREGAALEIVPAGGKPAASPGGPSAPRP